MESCSCKRGRTVGPGVVSVLVVAGALSVCGPVWAEPPAGVPIGCAVESMPTPVAEGAPLTLRDAVAAALVGNPELDVVACEMRVREAQQVVAGLSANPQFQLEVENVAGSGIYREDNQGETTAMLSQLFQLGGKRGKRTQVAGLGRDLVEWDYETRRAEVLGATAKAVVLALGAQERLAIAAARVRVAERTIRSVAMRVEAGAAPPVEVARAEVDVGRARITHRRASDALEAARLRLAGAWGSVEPRFSRVEGTLRNIEQLTAFAESVNSIADNPNVARWETEQAHRAASLSVARAARIPNVTLGAGGRYFSTNGDHGLVALLSVPLPVLDRGDAGIGVARQQLAQVAIERRRAERAARVQLAAARQRLTAARDEATALRDGVIPEAERAIAAAADAFRRGLVHFTDLLATELTAFELREEEIAALESAHLAVVDMATLTGASPVSVDGRGEQ